MIVINTPESTLNRFLVGFSISTVQPEAEKLGQYMVAMETETLICRLVPCVHVDKYFGSASD